MTKTMYDPPSGWKYGWPKSLKEGETYEEALIASGYPEDDLEFAMKYTRMWQEEQDVDNG